VGPSLTPPDPPLGDGVVSLRLWAETDVDQIREACQDPRTQQYIPIPRPYGRADAEAYVERTHRQWSSGEKAAFAIVDANDHAVVLGAISLAVARPTGNAAYWIAPGVRGLGLASRALRLVTHWGMHEVGLGVILLEIHHSNEASRRVAEAAGYHVVGQLEVPDDPAHHRAGRTHLLFAHLASDPEPG
jgi:RimJ/RimL family protein N-acetyltransferase